MVMTMLVVGLVLGGTLALMALGLTIQYGAARIVNLAFGQLVIGGSFLTYLLITAFGLRPFIALPVMMTLGYAAFYIIHSVAMRPLGKWPGVPNRLEVDPILLAFGLMFFLQGVYTASFCCGFPGRSWLEFPVGIFGAKVSASRLASAMLTLLIGGALCVAMRKIHWGGTIGAIALRSGFVPLARVGDHQQTRMAFAIGGALAAAGGVTLSTYQSFTPTDGVFLMIKAFVIIMMGYMDKLSCAIAAGLILALIEVGVSAAFDPELTLTATYANFLLVLLWRPNGLSG